MDGQRGIKKTLSVDDGNLGRKKKKNPVCRRRQFRAERRRKNKKIKTLSVDNEQFKKKKKKKKEERGLVCQGPETSISGPGSQDLGFKTSTHKHMHKKEVLSVEVPKPRFQDLAQTDRLRLFISSIDIISKPKLESTTFPAKNIECTPLHNN